MENFSQEDINQICEILDKAKRQDLVEKLKNAKIIPALYVHTFIKRVKYEIDVEQGVIPKREHHYSIISWNSLSTISLDAVKMIIEDAIKRENLICDFSDSRHPEHKIGPCENMDHNDYFREVEYSSESWQHYHQLQKDNPDKQMSELMPVPNSTTQTLSLVLQNDIDTQKWDDTSPEYWCKTCCKHAEGGDCEISCDMEGIDK